MGEKRKPPSKHAEVEKLRKIVHSSESTEYEKAEARLKLSALGRAGVEARRKRKERKSKRQNALALKELIESERQMEFYERDVQANMHICPID